jgi:type I restriction enzyme S subunit
MKHKIVALQPKDEYYSETGRESRIVLGSFPLSWEQRKVGELLIERNEQAPMSEEYPLMAFIANEGVAPKGERYDRSSLVSDTENKPYKRTEFGDFIYSSNNLETGSIGLNKYGKASISPVYSIFQPTGIADSDFLGRRLVRKDFINEMVKWRQGVIYGQWRIHESDFIKIEIPVPSVQEQREIGAFLDNLDNLITLHQRKYEKLQNIKKSCLEKMFPKTGCNVPEIRFKGFTDAWEQRKLGEIATEINRNDPESTAPIMMITANNGFIEQSERYAFNNAGESLKRYILLEKGELAYNHGASKLRPYGSCFALTTVESARIPFVYHCFSVGENDSEFVSIELNGTRIEGQLRRIVSSGARMDGLLNISFAEYGNVELMLPNIDEQKQLSAFFRSLDNLITLHQRELEKLQNLKKACLEKMFV